MPRADETFIVRVRHQEGDAVVEQPRLSRRHQVRHVAQVGEVILRWLGQTPARPGGDDSPSQHDGEGTTP